MRTCWNLPNHGKGLLWSGGVLPATPFLGVPIVARGITIALRTTTLLVMQAPLATNINGAHRVTINGGLRETGESLGSLHLFGAHEAHRVRNSDPYWFR